MWRLRIQQLTIFQWFDKLHSHGKCSNFIHDALKIIEEEMIIVLSEGHHRSSSTILRQKFEGIHSRCMSDNNYCLTPTPVSRVSRPATAVEANLSVTAKLTIAESNPKLLSYDKALGIRKSTRLEQLD